MTPILDVQFFRTGAGAEPVREWLKDLPAVDRKTIGEDLHGQTMVLLHGFIKKQQSTPSTDLDLAKTRLKLLKRK